MTSSPSLTWPASETAAAGTATAIGESVGESALLPFASASQTVSFRQPQSYDAQLYNYKATKGRAFLCDRAHSSTALPVILPKGIPYAANFISFDELQRRKPIGPCKQDEVGLTAEEVRLLYRAKCADQHLVPSWEREVRFMELISANCKGNFFCLSENGFGVCSADALAHILSTNKQYSIVDLSGNRLRDEGATAIAALLRANRAIVHMGLCSNDIGHEGGVALARALEENNTVVSLDLGTRSGANGNHIGTHGAEAMGRMLRSNRVLSKLNLSSNGLCAAGLGLVSAGLECNRTLTHLDISSNGLGEEGARTLASVLASTALTHLHVQRNGLGDVGGRRLFAAIAETVEAGSATLELLDVGFNECGEQTARAIKKVLVASTTLRTLYLSGNRFGPAVRHIAEGLCENKRLTALHLSECDVRGGDGAGIGSALANNHNVRILDLSRNKLCDGGAREVARGLAANHGLVYLNLSANRIGDEGGKAIAASLLANSTLRELKLRRNVMSVASGDLLNENLRMNTAVQTMDVTYNDFSFKCCSDIKATLERNGRANKQLIIPKLNGEIEQLAPREKELAQVEENIEMEKRIIKDRSEQLLRRNEEARVVAEKARRDVADLEKTLEQIRVSSEAVEEAFHQAEDRITTETAAMKAKKLSMESRVQQERDRAERLQREMERVRRQIGKLQEAENRRLAPLLRELQDTELDRDREREDAKFKAEKVVALELRRKELQISLSNRPKAKKR